MQTSNLFETRRFEAAAMLPHSLSHIFIYKHKHCPIHYFNRVPHNTHLMATTTSLPHLSSISSFLILAAFFNCLIISPLAHNISKGLMFPDFKGNRLYDIKTLGSARIDQHSGVVHIPGAQVEVQSLANQAGRALFWSPLRMLDPETGTPASFDTTFSFKIDTTPADLVESSSSGLTFLIAPDEVTVGRAGGWLGMMNDACDENYKPFAIEFDTFKNEEFGDPNDNHVGINLGSIVSHRTADAASAGVSFRDGSTVRAWVNYDSSTSLIEVKVAKEGADKPSEPLISALADLSQIFKEYMFVGFSAATGTTAQIHSILSWNFTSQSKAKIRFPHHETCQKRLRIQVTSESSSSNSSSRIRPPNAFIIFIVLVFAVLLVVLNLVCFRCWKQTRTQEPYVLKLSPRSLYKPRRFSLEELLDATKSFSDEEILGSGERSVFFRGVLPDGSQLAIKRFSPEFLKMCPNPSKLFKEVASIASLQHPNLVPLRGWCHDQGELLLAYEYMPNESVDAWLYSRWVLPWPRRHKIVREVANALAYLHSNGGKKCVVHQDVRTSNVFLDITFRARLGDFGVLQRSSAESCREKFSRCLISHEACQSRRWATAELDVYCFGVMVLEIVSGRRAVEKELQEEEIDLVGWAWSVQEGGNLLEVADKRLGVRYSREQLACLLQVGLLCTQADAQARPSMDMVVKYLSGDTPLPKRS